MIDFGPGMVALRRGDLNGAVTGFMKTLETDPENVPVHMMLAMALLQGRSWNAALHVLYAVIRIDPRAERPYTDPDQVDDGIAEALIGWAGEIAGAGYREPIPTELSQGLAYYLATFRHHANAIASVEAALRHRMPVVAAFTPRAAD